ncbi:hypothetical protein [Streptomyces sp. NPDC051014]|uniref:hypothetical protein n=1 Tax=Streptomyces sp. NPDC051014 TaxID=3155751 RepID=UPI0033EEE47B
MAVLLTGWVGPALDAPRAVLDLFPYGHLPKLPGGPMAWGPVAARLGAAVAPAFLGLAGVRRRDMTG